MLTERLSAKSQQSQAKIEAVAGVAESAPKVGGIEAEGGDPAIKADEM